MLLPIVFIAAFLAALTGALLDNYGRAARVEEHAAVARYSDVALADGVADFTHGLAQFVQANGTAGPWPSKPSQSALKGSCEPSPARSCPFHYSIRATLTAESGAGGPDLNGDTAANVQAAVIDEQRVSAIVTVTVTGPAANVLGTRTRYLTYRVFETAPFAVISGSREGAAAMGAQADAEGDTGGSLGAAESPGSPSSDDVADTRIHVRLTCGTIIPNLVPNVNDQQVAGNFGLPWGNAANAAHEAPCTTKDTPADAFRDEHWHNGDTNASGWTR